MTVNAQSQGRKAFLLTLTGVILGLGLSGCPQSNPNASEPLPRVVATSTILEDLTARVGADEIQLTGLLTPGDDPHIYEPVPLDSAALEQADLIIYNGHDLEPQLIRLMNAVGQNARKVAVGEVVPPLDFTKGSETLLDPHVWGNVKNVILMVEVIRDELIQLSPENREVFTQNAEQLTQELEQLDTWIAQQIATIPPQQRQLITTHDAFQYYAKAYGLNIVGTLIGISTEEQPSARTLQQLVKSIQESKVPAIFAETTINSQLIQTVAEEAGVKLAETELYSDSIGVPGSEGDSYTKMMMSNTRAIVEALGGQYTPLIDN